MPTVYREKEGELFDSEDVINHKFTRVVFIADASSSMCKPAIKNRRGGKTLATRQAILQKQLSEYVQQFDKQIYFNIITFSSTFTSMSEELMSANMENQQKALDFIEKMRTSRGTDIKPSLDFALSQKPQKIFLLTDGEVWRHDLCSRIQCMNVDPKVQVDTTFFAPRDESHPWAIRARRLMRDIANATGGEFHQATVNQEEWDFAEFAKAFGKVPPPESCYR
jgi:hypothetical protein